MSYPHVVFLDSLQIFKSKFPRCLAGAVAVIIVLALSCNPAYSAAYAVTEAGFDDMGAILTSMGYSFSVVPNSSLSNYSSISTHTVLFINCSAQCDLNAPSAKDSLRTFVDNGGVVYASDWAYIYLKTSFGDDYIRFHNKIGISGEYLCNVANEGLRDYLNADSILLDLNLGAWVPINTISSETEEYLRGSRDNTYPAHVSEKPMMVKFSHGKGAAIYTAFHNEAQLTAQQKSLMEYMVLMAVASNLTKELVQYLQTRGYIIVKENLNKIGNGQASADYFYNVNTGHELAFGLKWNTGTMRLEVYRPNGSLYASAEGSESPLTVYVPAPESGSWKYRVIGQSISTTNEPYALIAGKRTPPATGLDGMVVAPNPFVKPRGDTVIIFDNLTSVATLRIFTINGELVKKIEKSDATNGSIFWDITNSGGQEVASGVYIYVVTDDRGNRKKGKIAVIR